VKVRLKAWLGETHSTGFELRRHFVTRFFDSDLVSTPGQWQVVAGGVLAVLVSLSLIFTQAYYHKYAELNGLPDPEQLGLAVLADVLFLVTLSMLLAGLFTTLLWPQMFPGLSDYLALGALPLRMRDIFVAKFTALAGFALLFIVAITSLPSLMLPMVMSGRWAPHTASQVPAIFVSTSLAALFVFFSAVAVQGALLNLAPIRYFARLSLATQGLLLTILLCALPLAISIPSLQHAMNRRPDWIVWIPSIWFLGLDQALIGVRDPMALRLARLSVAGVSGAAGAAVLSYLWSYRRHRVRLLESPAMVSKNADRDGFAAITDRLFPNPRELAVFAFIAKTLARSRQHRLALTAFAGLAVAVIFDSFVSLALSRGFRGFSVVTPALRRVAVSAPLALSLFVLAGFRYLFRLPVELRANWVFQLAEHGNSRVFLNAVARFLLYCAVAPVALITLPAEFCLLGPGAGGVVAILCLLPSLTLMEALLMQVERIPFTSSYLPGRRPMIETLVLYGVSVGLYVSALSAVIVLSLQDSRLSLGLFAALLVIWLRVRKGRSESWELGRLQFEELPEPTIQTLRIQRD
jgi:hypothetical protein